MRFLLIIMIVLLAGALASLPLAQILPHIPYDHLPWDNTALKEQRNMMRRTSTKIMKEMEAKYSATQLETNEDYRKLQQVMNEIGPNEE